MVMLTITPAIISTKPRITATSLPVNSTIPTTSRQIAQKGHKNHGTRRLFDIVFVLIINLYE